MSASPDELKRLTSALIGIGKSKPETRKSWIEVVLGRPFATASDITSDDVTMCLSQIETDKATLSKARAVAEKVFGGRR